MTLLNPIFDVHLRKINELKISAFAATNKAKKFLSNYFKANDYVYSFNESGLTNLLKACYSEGLKVHVDDNLRHRNRRSKDK